MKTLITLILTFIVTNVYASGEPTKKQLCRSDITGIALTYRALGEIAGEISLRQMLVRQATNQESKNTNQRLVVELSKRFDELLAQGNTQFEDTEKTCIDQIPD